MFSSRIRPIAIVAAACAVLTTVALSACSSSTNGKPGGSTPNSASVPTGSSTATPPAKDALAAMVLQQSDVPSGWTGVAYEPDPGDATKKAKFSQCTGSRSTGADRVTEVHSDDYSSDNATVSSQAGSYKSAADIDADRASITSPKASTCYEQLARSQLGASMPSGTTIDHLDVKITPPVAGDPSGVIGHGTATVAITASGQQVTAYSDAVFIVGPLVEAEVDFTKVGSPVPSDLQTKLVKVVADRVANS